MTAYVIPTIRVSSRAVLDHWVEAFGIELQTIYGEGDVVEHAQLRLGDGRLMAGTSRDEDVGKPPKWPGRHRWNGHGHRNNG